MKLCLGRLIFLAVLGVSILAGGCSKPEVPAPAAEPVSLPAVALPDPRSDFESSRLLPGIQSSLGEFFIALAGGALPRCGPQRVPGLGVAIARGEGPVGAEGALEERILLVGSEGEVLASAALPSPALALLGLPIPSTTEPSSEEASAGPPARLLAAESSGSLRAFDASLAELWSREALAAAFMVALPGGRAALLSEEGRIRVLDTRNGAELWTAEAGPGGIGLAYALGQLVAAGGLSIVAFDDSDGRELWRTELSAPAVSLAAGGGRLLLLDEAGRLSLMSADSGRMLAEGAGRFLPFGPAVLDANRAVALLADGTLAELDAASGKVLEARQAPQGFLLGVGRDQAFIAQGRRLFALSRHAQTPAEGLELPAPPVALAAVPDGQLFSFASDGSVLILGAGSRRNSATSRAFEPSAEVRARMAERLGKYRSAAGMPPDRYLRFDLYVPGLPIEPELPGFVALRYREGSGGTRIVTAEDPPARVLISVFSEEGEELEANIDEVESPPRLSRRFEQGRTYWIVTGPLSETETAYRVQLR